jgi:hypothetical protein
VGRLWAVVTLGLPIQPSFKVIATNANRAPHMNSAQPSGCDFAVDRGSTEIRQSGHIRVDAKQNRLAPD